MANPRWQSRVLSVDTRGSIISLYIYSLLSRASNSRRFGSIRSRLLRDETAPRETFTIGLTSCAVLSPVCSLSLSISVIRVQFNGSRAYLQRAFLIGYKHRISVKSLSLSGPIKLSTGVSILRARIYVTRPTKDPISSSHESNKK